MDEDVGFLYRTMLTRDPKKRQVKPVQPHMLTLNFGGLDDSEDDDDYQLPHGKDGSGSGDDSMDEDSVSAESEEGSDSEGHHGDRNDDVSVSRISDDVSMSSDRIDLTLDDALGDLVPETTTSRSATATSLAPSEVDTVFSVDSASKKPLKVLICSVCLQDYSEGDDEIVECDNCAVAVHEGCYGMTESVSVASTVSSASTEPWFCDACKAGVKPHCELCPNFGGIFKETDAGRWVHLVCALYIPGAAFGDIDKLSPVTLFEMNYSKWGAKECTLCEDVRFSRTGVCICCDAGMCRNYFHVTCAQREGLLNEAPQDEDIADPFYAHCKQHVDKSMMKMKRRNWLAVQSSRGKTAPETDMDTTEQDRVHRKLERHRRKYAESQMTQPPCWIPQQKMPRMLTSSASAMRKLMRKAELLGINTEKHTVTASQQTDVSKKWHLPPAFSVEFVSYFLDRDERILKMRSRQRELKAAKESLQSQEKVYRAKYEKLSSSTAAVKNKYKKLLNEGNQLWQLLCDIAKKKLKVPSYLKQQQAPPSGKKESEEKKSQPLQPIIIHECAKCRGSHDQHQLARCDMCKEYYHLSCLDPPLTRMPKKTKLYGWQCSECISSSSSDSNVSVDTSAPMRLREMIKEPKKFTQSDSQTTPKKKEKKKVKKKKKQKAGETQSAPVKKANTTPKVKKEVDIRTECVECGRPGDNSTLVRCDGCRDCFHFLCLDPPMKTSPKRRGYDWLCNRCSPSDTDDEDDVIVVQESVDDSFDVLMDCEQDQQ